MSGVDLADGTSIRKGASDAIVEYVKGLGGTVPADLQGHTDQVSKQGGTPSPSAWASVCWVSST